jgi:hypothetical protein
MKRLIATKLKLSFLEEYVNWKMKDASILPLGLNAYCFIKVN